MITIKAKLKNRKLFTMHDMKCELSGNLLLITPHEYKQITKKTMMHTCKLDDIDIITVYENDILVLELRFSEKVKTNKWYMCFNQNKL